MIRGLIIRSVENGYRGGHPPIAVTYRDTDPSFAQVEAEVSHATSAGKGGGPRLLQGF